MKLLFKAEERSPTRYFIKDGKLNGIDFSYFVEGSEFRGNDETYASGIRGAKWDGGELYITLSQSTSPYQIQAVSHDWGSIGWIDAQDYNPEGRYVQATNPHAVALIESGKAEYKRLENGAWTVVHVENIEENTNDE